VSYQLSSASGVHQIDLSARISIPQHPEGSRALAELIASTANAAAAEQALETARGSVAGLIGASEAEVVFTSGGAEASSAAIKGLALAARAERGGSRRIVLTAVEHSPVLHSARSLSRLGFEVVEVPVDGTGRVDAGQFAGELRKGAALGALQWANDELGTVQPVRALAQVAADLGIPLHADATAAAGWVAVDWSGTPVSSLAISSRRMGGPPGAGALILRRDARWFPLVEGGLEEDGRRAGLQHPALVAAFGLSAAAARLHLDERARAAACCRQRLADECRAAVPGLTVHGSQERRLPGHLSVGVPGAHGEALLLELSREGIIAEAGSACAESGGLPSRILRAIGLSAREASSSLLFRATAGHDPADMRRVAQALGAAAVRLQAMAP
jgi:cysteine desulfurase